MLLFLILTLFLGEGMSAETVFRRQSEIDALLSKKGGILICILRPHPAPNNLSKYQIMLAGSANVALNMLVPAIRPGAGSTFSVMHASQSAASAYLQTLKGALSFVAFLSASEAQISRHGGTVLAVNSVNDPIAVEFRIGEAVLSFVPVPHNVPGDRLGAAIVNTVRRHYEKQPDVDAPAWVSEVSVPGVDLYDGKILELTRTRDQIAKEIATLEGGRTQLANHRRLLFGYGKAILEAEVRAAFRVLGFAVPEPDQYSGEWDVELRDGVRTAIGEVEGSEGVVDVDKYRQLLDYIDSEALDGRDHKGMLIGNGFRLQPLDAPDRERQFSDHALRGAARNQFCLLPTSELFKAVCAVLERPTDEGLRIKIRDSIFATVGVWSFQR